MTKYLTKSRFKLATECPTKLFYTGKPIGYKYIALGDFLVFTLMGPLMVIGSYYVLTGDYNTNVLYVSLPVGFLVAAILHANNLRGIVHDTQANVKTLAKQRLQTLGQRSGLIDSRTQRA